MEQGESGPFGECTYEGQVFRPGQGNNAYVFPGIGPGVVAARARRIPESIFLTAARTLASLVRDEDLGAGSLYPRLREIRQVSLAIATKVAEEAHALGLARRARPLDIEGYVYDP